MMNRFGISLFAVLCALLLALPCALAEEGIEGWAADSPAMQSIVAFVTASADETSEGYIPKADRIAVFDMDGTLYGERFPTYFNDWLFIQRALYDDSYDAPEDLRSFARAWEDQVLRGIPIPDFDTKERAIAPQLYAGLTPENYADVVRRFKALPVWGFENMTYGEAYFQPMVSLVRYLSAHDYTVYIVSATYRDAVRVMTEGVLDDCIPSGHVIGTDLLYVASGDEAADSMFYELQPEDELVIAGELFIKNQKTNKATAIQREIGKMPALAFGNSTGDFSMATYTLQNTRYGGQAYMLLCDDTERDYGDPEAAEAFRQKCVANGFHTISERDEFVTLYTGQKAASATTVEDLPAAASCQLEQVVVLSRHGIRAPLSNSGSAVAELTPYTWTAWTAPESELTLKGGVAETLMGQYFRKWLEAEGLFPENAQPTEDEVRFYANSRQRTIATARYFATGLFPLANVEVTYSGEIGSFDPVFKPVYTFMSDSYRDAVMEQIRQRFGLWAEGEARQRLAEDYALLATVIDFENASGYISGASAPWVTDDVGVTLAIDKETSVSGSLKVASAAGDALMLQFYEMADAQAAAFGHDLTLADWTRIADINTTYQAIRYGSQLIGVNVAHPMLQELLSELLTADRKFTFLCGHDSNVATVLSALGVTDYTLPDTIETRTPIGCKLLFERWRGPDGTACARVRLVYQSTDQLRDLSALTLDSPPVSWDVPLPGLTPNADGLYLLDDVLDCLREAIDAYDLLLEQFDDTLTEMDNAA